MISSLNAYGGMSASQLLSLFATKPASSSSDSASSGDTNVLTSIGSSTFISTDPAGAIKKILANARVQGSSALTLGGTDNPATASGTSDNSSTSIQLGSSIPTVGSSENVTSTVSSFSVSSLGDTPLSSGFAVTNVSNSSTTGDAFDLSASFGGNSLSVDFTVQGLGPLTQTNAPYDLSAGNGDSSITLGFGIGKNNQGTNAEISVSGLSSAQAHQLAAAFEAATALPGQTTAASEYATPDGYATQFNTGALEPSNGYFGFSVLADYGVEQGS